MDTVLETSAEHSNKGLDELLQLFTKGWQNFKLLMPYFPKYTQPPTRDEIETAYKQGQILNKTKNWTEEEERLLEYTTLGLCMSLNKTPYDLKMGHWSQIAQIITGRQWKMCRSRWLSTRSIPIITMPWTNEEDQTLRYLYNKYSSLKKHNKWSEIAIEMSRLCKTPYIRMGKQCRERWINKLDPQVNRGPWYKEEELKLFELIYKYGKRWSMVAVEHFKNARTENSIKNRYHAIFKKESNKYRDIKELQNQIKLEPKPEQDDRDFHEELLMVNIIRELKEQIQKQSDLQNGKLENSQNYQICELEEIDDSYQFCVIKKDKIYVFK